MQIIFECENLNYIDSVLQYLSFDCPLLRIADGS